MKTINDLQKLMLTGAEQGEPCTLYLEYVPQSNLFEVFIYHHGKKVMYGAGPSAMAACSSVTRVDG